MRMLGNFTVKDKVVDNKVRTEYGPGGVAFGRAIAEDLPMMVLFPKIELDATVAACNLSTNASDGSITHTPISLVVFDDSDIAFDFTTFLSDNTRWIPSTVDGAIATLFPNDAKRSQHKPPDSTYAVLTADALSRLDNGLKPGEWCVVPDNCKLSSFKDEAEADNRIVVRVLYEKTSADVGKQHHALMRQHGYKHAASIIDARLHDWPGIPSSATINHVFYVYHVPVDDRAQFCLFD